jgi:hypothetical protein
MSIINGGVLMAYYEECGIITYDQWMSINAKSCGPWFYALPDWTYMMYRRILNKKKSFEKRRLNTGRRLGLFIK